MEIIYQDPDIVVVNKPPGIAVHGGDRVKGETLVDSLLRDFPEIRGVGEDPLRPGIVHRLDKYTSGVMVIARNQHAFESLKDIFKNRRAEKTYWAIACGSFKEKHGVVALPIGRVIKNPTKRGVASGRARVRGERDAITEYRVLKEGGGFSLVEVRPKTGRMHQIRVHLAALGHPVACDRIYGGERVPCPALAGAAVDGVERHFLLHAKSLAFSMGPGKKFLFEADPPENFARIVKQALV